MERHKQDTLIPARVELKARYPMPLLESVDWAMAMDPTKRPQDAGEMLAVLKGLADDLPRSRLGDSGPASRLRESVSQTLSKPS
jgi:hypothetical protein